MGDTVLDRVASRSLSDEVTSEQTLEQAPSHLSRGNCYTFSFVPCIVSFSFRFLPSTSLDPSVLPGGFPDTSGDLWPSNHIDKEKLKITLTKRN